ncbi:MAG: LysR family positive regulator for ilvC [Gammaproteobacteria bacterium]|jgi:LysR family positive regulator for ilvC
MDQKSLTLFVHLANSLHFGKTSEALHVSPSTLSRVVQRLEQELGSSLFDRDNRRVKLTPEGEVFLNYAQQNLEQLAILHEKLQKPEVQAKGSISLFCSVTAVYGVLSPVLETLRRQYPEIELQLHTGDQAEAIDRVADGQVDLAIAVRPPNLSKRLAFNLLTYSPLQFIAPSVPCAIRDQFAEVDPSNLQQQPKSWWLQLPFIIQERGVVRDHSIAWLKGFSIKPKISAHVSGNEAIVSMVSLGLGVAVVPKLVLEDSIHAKQVSVINADIDNQALAIGVVSRQEDRNKPVIRAFLDSAERSLDSNR